MSSPLTRGRSPGEAGTRDELVVDRSFHTASSAEADAVVVADGAGLANDPAVITYVQSAHRHFKVIAAWGDGAGLLTNAGIADYSGSVHLGQGDQDVRQRDAVRSETTPPMGSGRDPSDASKQRRKGVTCRTEST